MIQIGAVGDMVDIIESIADTADIIKVVIEGVDAVAHKSLRRRLFDKALKKERVVMMTITVIEEGSTIDVMVKSTTIRAATDIIAVTVMTKKETTRIETEIGMIRRSIIVGTTDTEAPHLRAVTKAIAEQLIN